MGEDRGEGRTFMRSKTLQGYKSPIHNATRVCFSFQHNARNTCEIFFLKITRLGHMLNETMYSLSAFVDCVQINVVYIMLYYTFGGRCAGLCLGTLSYVLLVLASAHLHLSGCLALLRCTCTCGKQ